VQAIEDAITKELEVRRFRPRALYDAANVKRESRARRIAIVQVDAHPAVKVALLMAERLTQTALLVDAVLFQAGNPAAPIDSTTEKAVAPHVRSLREWCKSFSGSPERQRDRLIALVEHAASMLADTNCREADWNEHLQLIQFDLASSFPDIEGRLGDNDIRSAIAACLPRDKRSSGAENGSKWAVLSKLIRRAGMGSVAPETLRTEYVKRRSARQRQLKTDSDDLLGARLGNKVDGLKLTPEAKKRVEAEIAAIEARALQAMKARTTRPR